MLIEDGVIKAIESPAERSGEQVDAKEYLALPSFIDNHIHLDKGHFGGPWVSVVPAGSVAERIVEEEEFLKDFLPDTHWKAQALIDLITGFGATHLRVQVNVDPVIELENFKIIREVLENNKHKLTYEIVAFPQHGTLRTEAKGLLEEALKEGADYLGGLDPAIIDGDIEKSLTTTFDLAKKYGKKIDFHVHTGQNLGIYEIKRILNYIDEYEMNDMVTLSHAFSLNDIGHHKQVELAKEFVKRGVTLNTTQPINGEAYPFMTFLNEGVDVNIVNDNINDHWNPFGTGDMAERLNRGCQIHNFKDEYTISRTLPAITGGILPLNNEGERIWPKVGDKANILLSKSDSSAHLIARLVPERVTMFEGEIVNGEFI